MFSKICHFASILYTTNRQAQQLKTEQRSVHGKTSTKNIIISTGIRRITTFRSTTDRKYNTGPVR